MKLDASALVGYYTKSYVGLALAGKQRLIAVITSLSVDTITAASANTAASYSTTGTANLGSINIGMPYVSTSMQLVGTISIGELLGSTWIENVSSKRMAMEHLPAV